MPSFSAVSTFHKAGLEQYGRRMMATYAEHWPSEVPLTVYAEGWEGPVEGAEVRDLLASSPWLAAFKARHKDNADAHGRAGGRYSFLRDAVRFSHKIAAVTAASQASEADYLIWVDGDVVTHSPVSVEDFEGLAPGDGEWISWLWRDHTYPECGFYILDCRHPRHAEMMIRLRMIYETGAVFALPQTHDSFVLAELVKRHKIRWKSLSGPKGEKTMHPLINGPLGSWLDHLKGPRKTQKRSNASDLKVARTEAHWQ